MDKKQTNTELYFQSLKAKAIVFFGVILLVISILLLVINPLLSIIMIIISIIIIIRGKAMLFDYKMKSGYIIHKGE
jgi:membrane-bound ClpP family serine protease